MTRQALEDAYIAGFKDGRDSVGKVSDNDAATHCLLGFDGWWSNALDTLNRAPVADDGLRYVVRYSNEVSGGDRERISVLQQARKCIKTGEIVWQDVPTVNET